MLKSIFFQLPIMIIAIAMIFATGCQQAGPANLSEADIEAIKVSDKAWQEHALANDWEALASLYAENAMYMAPNQSAIIGRDNLQSYMESQPPTTAVEIVTHEIDGSGDFAFSRGTYTQTFSQEGMDPITDSGKYLAILKKQEDGSWLIIRDIFNSDLPLE